MTTNHEKCDFNVKKFSVGIFVFFHHHEKCIKKSQCLCLHKIESQTKYKKKMLKTDKEKKYKIRYIKLKRAYLDFMQKICIVQKYDANGKRPRRSA